VYRSEPGVDAPGETIQDFEEVVDERRRHESFLPELRARAGAQRRGLARETSSETWMILPDPMVTCNRVSSDTNLYEVR
jgi:hypothetical protein